MTEIEAIAVLREEILVGRRLLQPLDSGQAIDRHAAERVGHALEVLQHTWANRECVPKEAVLAMTYLDMAGLYGNLDPDIRKELGIIELDLMRRALRSLGKEG